jgi:hypothetical protein
VSDIELPNFMKALERAYKKERKATGKNIKPCEKMQKRHHFEMKRGTHREYGVKRMTPNERADAQNSAKGG